MLKRIETLVNSLIEVAPDRPDVAGGYERLAMGPTEIIKTVHTILTLLAPLTEAQKHEVPPTPCDQDIFKNGSTVAMYSGGMIAMEGLVKEACRNGLKMDWHYAGGVAVVLSTDDTEKCRKALENAIPTRV